MSCYEALAGSYDALTTDVDYEKRADFLESCSAAAPFPSGWCWTWPAARAR